MDEEKRYPEIADTVNAFYKAVDTHQLTISEVACAAANVIVTMLRNIDDDPDVMTEGAKAIHKDILFGIDMIRDGNAPVYTLNRAAH